MVGLEEVLKVDRKVVLLGGLTADLLEAPKVALWAVLKGGQMGLRVDRMAREVLLVLKMGGWLQCHP